MTLPSIPPTEAYSEPWEDPDLLRTIYRNPNLADALSKLERDADFVDQSDFLSSRVNTTLSASNPVAGWARYREAYSPELVQLLLREFPPPSKRAFILDPMCGSGSTQLGAQTMGYMSLGLDVSPYATLLSKVKSTPLPRDAIARIRQWLPSVQEMAAPSSRSATDKFLATYFPPANLDALLSIRAGVESDFRADTDIRDFLMVALLAIVEDCSNRRKDGNGLLTRPSKVRSPQARFVAQVQAMLTDLEMVPIRKAAAFTHTASAINVKPAVDELRGLQRRQLGAIVFSPPYPNSFDYFESYKLELLFGRLFDVPGLRAARKDLVRSYRQSGSSERVEELPTVETLIAEVMSRIPEKEAVTGVRDGRSRLLPNLLRGYFLDMREVMRSAYDVMPAGTRMHIIVDQSAYVGVPIPTDLLLADIGTQTGLVFERLTLCRRARTSAQQLRKAPVLSQLLRETVVTLQKA